jgi:CRP-like cAMP-binding protein
MLSPEGRERLLAVNATGDIFGESRLSGLGPRLETASATEESILKQIPCPEVFARLQHISLE